MKKLLTALIVDDELASRNALIEILKKEFPAIELIGTIERPEEAVVFLSNNNPDIVFLEVQMQHYSGFDLLDAIPNLGSQIIFTSEFQEYALRAIRYNAIDFLLKPLRLEDLHLAINIAIRNKKEKLSMLLNQFDSMDETDLENVNNAKIAIKANDKIVKLNEVEIKYLKADGNYTEFNCSENRKYFVSKNLKEFESMLSTVDFLRVHHSYLINTMLPFVFDTITNEVVFDDNARVPVSVRKKKMFLDKYLSGVKSRF
jgi:two-component system LytT family response regulator